MCRLAAYINLEAQPVGFAAEGKINKMLEHVFYCNSFGNTDGSGIMMMDSDGLVDTHKRAIPSTDFINTKWYDSQNLAKEKFVGMHTRYATVGGNSDSNSHPFQHGDITLMQNGTAASSPHHTVLTGKPSGCVVDSDSVAYAFDTIGVEETLDVYRGDGVFMWLDEKDKSFNIVKNDKRQLHFIQWKDKPNIIFFATEAYVLALAAVRAGIDFDKIHPVKDGTHHKYKVDNTYTAKPLEVQAYVPQVYCQHSHNNVRDITKKHLPVALPNSTNDNDAGTVEGVEIIYCGDCAICTSPVFHGNGEYFYHGSEVICYYCKEDAQKMLGKMLTRVDSKGVEYANT